MSFSLTDVMDGLAERMVGVAPNVYAWPVESISVPCIVIGYPTVIEYDTAMGGGGDRLVLPIWYVVGKAGSVAARDALSDILSTGMKTTLDGAASFGDIRVEDAAIEELVVAATTHLAARFNTEVYV